MITSPQVEGKQAGTIDYEYEMCRGNILYVYNTINLEAIVHSYTTKSSCIQKDC